MTRIANEDTGTPPLTTEHAYYTNERANQTGASMKTMNADRFLVICGIISFLLWVWPTPHRYFTVQDGNRFLEVRVNRITGSTEILRAREGFVASPKEYR